MPRYVRQNGYLTDPGIELIKEKDVKNVIEIDWKKVCFLPYPFVYDDNFDLIADLKNIKTREQAISKMKEVYGYNPIYYFVNTEYIQGFIVDDEAVTISLRNGKVVTFPMPSAKEFVDLYYKTTYRQMRANYTERKMPDQKELLKKRDEILHIWKSMNAISRTKMVIDLRFFLVIAPRDNANYTKGSSWEMHWKIYDKVKEKEGDDLIALASVLAWVLCADGFDYDSRDFYKISHITGVTYKHTPRYVERRMVSQED